jgi:phosphoribosylglycinamide formyltransferase-1
VTVRIAAFASGGGTNVQALLDHFGGSGPGASVGRLVTVISDRGDAGALERAERAGAGVRVIASAGREEGDVARDMLCVLEEDGVDIVALAGYVRLVPAEVVRRFEGRMVNVHPALLPAFGGHGMYGMRIHRAVLARGCRVTGATVHLVNEVYDEGPILCQWPVPVLLDDSAETLAARVLRVEHRLYPAAVEWLARSVAASPAGVGRDGMVLETRTAIQAFGALTAEAPPTADIRRALGLPDADNEE